MKDAYQRPTNFETTESLISAGSNLPCEVLDFVCLRSNERKLRKSLNTIIFDMDGIIFDTENMFLDCWRRIAAEYNLKDIDEVYRRVIGFHAEATKALYMDFYGQDFDYDKLNGLTIDMFFQKADTEGIPVKSGAKEILEYLSENNYQIGLASSTAAHLVKQQLGNAGLLKYFKVVVGGDMVEKSKPSPDIFLEACRKIGTPPEKAYAIEDSFNGVRAAYSAGMKVIMVPDIVKPDEEIKKLTVKILPNLLEVRDYFILQENANM
ncbi:MAG: HAD-IA family hydrolase [Lachnospiraceae bacterium]|nr:HAD-IA family hydrolase [Lachnospiraceae bacterium]